MRATRETSAFSRISAKYGNKHPISEIFGLFMVINTSQVTAQSSTDTISDSSWIVQATLTILCILFVWVLFVIRKALIVLKVNGQPVNYFSFSIFRTMTRHSSLVTSIVILIVLASLFLVIVY